MSALVSDGMIGESEDSVPKAACSAEAILKKPRRIASSATSQNGDEMNPNEGDGVESNVTECIE